MLISLSVANVVLIERLDLTCPPGLSALTGETGAGKSILLDALGLALGARADAALVRAGAAQATVAAEFELPRPHPAVALLAAQDFPLEDGLMVPVVVRRSVSAEGRSRAFVNDQPASIGLLRQLGDTLVEIHGQFATQGLLNPQTHRGVLDAFAGTAAAREETRRAWTAWRSAGQALEAARQASREAAREESWLRHAVSEIDELAPEPGEEEALAHDRAFLMNREKLAAGIGDALKDLAGERGAERPMLSALKTLERLAEKAQGRLEGPVAALDRAAAELAEATSALDAVLRDIGHDAGELERREERLFALRALGRKYQVEVDRLPGLRDELAARLSFIDEGETRLLALERAAEQAREAYIAAADTLGRERRAAAAALDRAVAAELPPLKLERARFATRIEALAEADWGPDGRERVTFEVATNPGAPAGPLAKIASGGELARFMLALKVVLAGTGSVPTLVFDEVDSGISGAVADAVGERLARLGGRLQVLVVTHSPQVAARAQHHWRVSKAAAGEGVATRVEALPAEARREEIARMLSGAEVTDAARAAADQLMAS
jgi:DNA repair protein RecN (Recombination protein N)